MSENSDEIDSIENILADTSFFLENFTSSKTSENFSPPEMSEPKFNLSLVDEDEMILINAVRDIEKYFWTVGEMPNFAEYLDRGITIEQFKEVINPKLKGRGLPEYKFNKIAPPVGNDGFDPRFVLACNVMCRATGKSKGAKFKDLASLGVNEPMWNAWLNMPAYFEYAKKIMEVQLESVTDLDAKMALARNVANGDLSSIKYYHEFTGRFRPQDQNATNLMLLISLLMESLARNVSAEIFDKIAGELEQTPVGELMRGS